MSCAVVLATGSAWGADKPDQDVTALIKALTQRLEAQDRKLEAQNRKISHLEGKLTDEAMQSSRNEDIARIMAEMRADASQRSAMPNWLDNLDFFGDMRLRFEHLSTDGVQLRERNRYRFRLRFGFVKTWLDEQMEVGFRLASGDSNNARSTNQTLTGTFTSKDVWIDRAYAKYSPNAIPGLTVIGGKMANPLEHTDLIWDSDITPEGIVAAYHREVAGIDFFGTFANFFVNEINQGGHDTILNVYQGGARAPLPCGINSVLAVTWYDFENYEDLGATANGWNRNMQMINILAKLKFKACGLPWQVYFDWVHNNQDNDETAGFENADDGYALGVKVGKNKKKGDWSAGYKYKYIEYNATPGGLNDADFGGRGPAMGANVNVKGHVFKAGYNLTDFLTAGTTFMLTQPIIGDRDENDFLMQFDLIWKF